MPGPSDYFSTPKNIRHLLCGRRTVFSLIGNTLLAIIVVCGSAGPSFAHLTAHANKEVVGAASWYNPYRPESKSPETETASGEEYDPNAWTAAIQIKLRKKVGGVRYGKNYKPSYVLVERGGKKVIVRINDVGPLMPGRVIDLNERAMRYFDRSLELGVLQNVKITLLQGKHWTPGPVGDETLVNKAVAWNVAEDNSEDVVADAPAPRAKKDAADTISSSANATIAEELAAKRVIAEPGEAIASYSHALQCGVIAQDTGAMLVMTTIDRKIELYSLVFLLVRERPRKDGAVPESIIQDNLDQSTRPRGQI